MNCSKCENPLRPTDEFCNKCGAGVDESKIEIPARSVLKVNKRYLYGGIALVALIAVLGFLALGKSSGNAITFKQISSAYSTEKGLSLAEDSFDGHRFYGTLGSDVTFFNSTPLRILLFPSESDRTQNQSHAFDLIKHYAPGEQIFACQNVIGMYDLSNEAAVMKGTKQYCQKGAVSTFKVTPFIGILKDYSLTTNGSGLQAIVARKSENSYRAVFIQIDKKNTKFVGSANFVDQGNGLMQVTWSDGTVNTANQIGGFIQFECAVLGGPGHIGGDYVDRADCGFTHSNDFNFDLSVSGPLDTSRWQSLDTVKGDPGLIASVKPVMNSKTRGFTINVYAQGQDGSVGQVTAGTADDLGFGYLEGKWSDGAGLFGTYSVGNPPTSIAKGVSASAGINFNCGQDPAMKSAAPFYSAAKGCIFLLTQQSNAGTGTASG
jgi:hypothetical protein